MMKLFRRNLFIYEIKNVLGNPFNLGFGFIFPIFMSLVLMSGIVSTLPKEVQSEVTIQFFVGYMIVVPLSIVLIGFVLLFSQEIENKAILRLNLFGYDNKIILFSKLLSDLVITFLGIIVYSIIVETIKK